MGMLKDQWNKLRCYMDGHDVALFASSAVDDAMRKKGWKLSFQTMPVIPTSMAGACANFRIITAPDGKRLTVGEDRQTYYKARRETAREVYGLN